MDIRAFHGLQDAYEGRRIGAVDVGGFDSSDGGVDTDGGAPDTGVGPSDLGNPQRARPIVEVSGGAGVGSSDNYRAKVVLSPLSPVGGSRSENFRANVGTRGGER